MTTESGLLIVDKPEGWTSHDVVAKIRRLAGTKRVGHAGTLDPMATGVLVVGVDKATRLLGYLALTEKEYTGTVRLGESTDTDDAQGSLVSRVPVMNIGEAELRRAALGLTGEISQIPPGVSAIKVDGQRAYRLARAGEAPQLAARAVTVSRFDIEAIRPAAAADGTGLLDLDIQVTCSSGTYIRALGRDLGAALGVGGHLTALRRTRVGPYLVSQARTMAELEAEADGARAAGRGPALQVLPMAAAAAAAFPRRELSGAEALALGHGARLAATGTGESPVAAFGPDGSLVALLADADGKARSLAVFASADGPG